MAKSKKWKVIVPFTILAVLFAAGIFYVVKAYYYQEHFMPGTVLNGTDISGMTAEEVVELYDHYQLTIVEKGEEGKLINQMIIGSDAGLSVTDGSLFEKMLKEQPVWTWPWHRGKEAKETTADIAADESKISVIVEGLYGISGEHIMDSEDACLSDYVKGEGYSIVKEVVGGHLDKEKTIAVIKDAVEHMDKEVNLVDKDCYMLPDVMSDNKKLNKQVKQLNRCLSAKITYIFDDEETVVDEELISQWLKIKKYSVSLDDAKIQEFVASIRRAHDTIFRSRSFKTSYGKKITISGGDYGWWMNTGAEVEKLTKLITKGKQVDRTPEYYQTAASYGENDYGNSYVEINLTAQHLLVYIKGKKVYETDFVSGNVSLGNSTPEGVYSLTYKEEMAELVGETYSSPVSYWMPFNMNIGMHDAPWRTRFGSNLYKTGGSHGCINLPCKAAKKIYGYVEKGFPVICYELPGTESTEETLQTNQDIADAVIESIEKIGTVTSESRKRIEHSRRIYNQLNSAQRALVTNYQTLVKAEQNFAKLPN